MNLRDYPSCQSCTFPIHNSVFQLPLTGREDPHPNLWLPAWAWLWAVPILPLLRPLLLKQGLFSVSFSWKDLNFGICLFPSQALALLHCSWLSFQPTVMCVCCLSTATFFVFVFSLCTFYPCWKTHWGILKILRAYLSKDQLWLGVIRVFHFRSSEKDFQKKCGSRARKLFDWL